MRQVTAFFLVRVLAQTHMLDGRTHESSAAVSGNIFASPNANQVLRAIELVDSE